MLLKGTDKIYRGVAILLFSFLLIYLILRIFLLSTLHDEVATYMFYFYQGDFWGENVVKDANNHLLNSLLGYILYKLFGDHFALLRLPNLVAFILYFWASIRLTRDLSTPALRSIGLVALNSVPFMMEYFGNARGYGLSMGFFAWGLVHGFSYLRKYSLHSLFLAYCSLLLAISANLTIMPGAGLMALLFFLAPLFQKPAGRTIWKEWLLHVLFGCGLIPFYLFGMGLRKAGALYYGSLDGLWEVTGKTLSRYVLFYDANWLLFAYLLLFAGFGIALVYLLRKRTFGEWLGLPITVLSVLLFGNLLIALLMAHLMGVNYPEDRAAMYLIPVVLLLILHTLDLFPSIRPAQWLLLGFPLSFAWHLSLDTSVFSPDDRMNRDFYAEVKKELTPDQTIMIYHIMNWNWPYLESHSPEKASVAQFDNPNGTLADILITKTTILKNPDIVKLYDTIAYHAPSTYIALRRKEPLQRILLDSTALIEASGNLEYADICQLDATPYRGKNLVLSVSGHLKTVAPHNKIQLVVQTINEDGSMGRYLYYSFETTYQSQLIDDDFLHHFILEKVTPEEKQIKVYLWNRALHLLFVKDASCRIFELNSPQNGTR